MLSNNLTFDHINMEYLALMSDGDATMQATIIEMLVAEIPTELASLRAAITAQDWVAAGNISHKFKSTLNFVGNEPMTAANANIERITRFEADKNGLHDLLLILEEYMPKVLNDLEAAKLALS